MSQSLMSRRTMLRGLGTAIALPVLESMIPTRLCGAEAKAAAQAVAAPKRVAWIYVPNGVHMPGWTPAKLGADYELSPILQPLAPVKEKMMVISGLDCNNANGLGDGTGDHARAMSAFLTGAHPAKSEARIRAGISADQVAASQIGHLTKFRSLELGIEEGKQVGSCDPGYSCAYSHTISWRNDRTPVVKDCDPRSVFDRLFSNGDPLESAESRARREGDRRSILDFVLGDATRLHGKLGYTDKQKMDEYLTAIREIEVRIAQSGPEETRPPAGAVRPDFDPRANVHESAERTSTSDNYIVHAGLMLDMTVLAFRADLTRVLTLPLADEGSNQMYPWAGANVPHHVTSHHQGSAAKQLLLAKINHFHVKVLAALLKKLDNLKDTGGGSILDNSLIAYGCGNADGDRHTHFNLPVLLFGKGGGTIKTGRHVRADRVPVTNLWLSMLDSVGAKIPKLGDSTGRFSLV
ncbi:MAG: DUF1552 domain-containing protein [Opitutaceae bacterium]